MPCFVYSFYTGVSLHLNPFWNIKIIENKLVINTSLIFILCLYVYTHVNILISVNQIFYTPTELSALSVNKNKTLFRILVVLS